MPSYALARRATMLRSARMGMRYAVPRRYMAAYKIARFAYRNRKNIYKGYRAAKRIRRTVKSKVHRRTLPGIKNPSLKKSDSVPNGPALAVTMGTLNIRDFPWPAHSNNDGLTIRNRNNIFVKGLKVCRHFQYVYQFDGANDIGEIEVHWGILQLKNDEDNTELSTELLLNFFRDNSGSLTRSRDFQVYTPTSVWDMGKNCFAINPNNKVRVITHQKKRLCPKSNQAQVLGKNIWKIDRYYKLKKRLSFSSTNADLPNQRLFEFYWYNTVTPDEFPSDPLAVQYIETDVLNTVYYSEK